MVGLVVVSHSPKIVEGIKDLALQMIPEEIPLALSGGTSDGRLGTDFQRILTAINQVYSEDGVLILYDLGSALMGAEMAKESLPPEKQQNISILKVPIVEGAVTAAVEISLGKDMNSIINAFKEAGLEKSF